MPKKSAQSSCRDPEPSNDVPPLARVVHEFLCDFPCKVHAFGSVNGNHKHPLAKGGFATATDDPAEIEHRFANPRATGYAVYPSDFIIIDRDRRDGKDGVAALEMLATAAVEEIPETAVVRTPSGGDHLYFNISDGVVVPSSNGKLAPGIDIRGNDGKYWAAGPGSQTPKGEYRWERGPEHMADAPTWLLDAILSAKGTGKKTLHDRRADYGEPTPWDHEQAERLVALIERGALIKDHEGPFVKGERDDLTFLLFAEAKNRMIHPDVMLEAVLEAGIDGGIGDDVVERKMQSAYHDGNTQDGYGSKVNAYWLPNHVFKPIVDGKPVDRPAVDPVEWKAANPDKLPKAFPGDPEPEPAADVALGARREFYYLSDFDAIPDPEFLIDGILPQEDYTALCGPRGARKSFLALDIGLSLASGTPYHGRDVKRGRVVYFAGEGARGTRRRVDAWFKARGLDRADFATDFALVPATPKWDTREGAEHVARTLDAIGKDGPIALVIIDTMRRAMSGDENSVRDVGHFTDEVGRLCKERGATPLIVHHVGKDPAKGARGGSNFEADAAGVFYLTKAKADAPSVLKCEKMKDGEDGWKLTFRADKITLGIEPSGRPITSLALALESESKSEDADNGQEPSARERYASHDAIAVHILERMVDPHARRGDLAKAVMGEMEPEMRENDPNAFNRALRAYREHLTRLGPRHPLLPYVDEKNDKGQPLTFHNATQRGRRAAKPGRRRVALSYPTLSDGGEDA